MSISECIKKLVQASGMFWNMSYASMLPEYFRGTNGRITWMINETHFEKAIECHCVCIRA